MKTITDKALFLYILSLCSNSVAFSVPKISTRQSLNLFSSSSEVDDAAFVPMSREAVESWLATIPVYAVLDENQGLVLLQEEGNDKEIANFFFKAETCNTLYEPIKKENEGADWDISQLGLGQVWFDLFLANDTPGVEYRLVPDTKEVERARMMVEQNSPGEPSELFKARYNEIPVFLDQRLRVKTDSGEDKVPMYLDLKNCMTTCQQAMDASPDDYESEISVAELTNLLHEMQSEDASCDFRQTILIPPIEELPELGKKGIKSSTAPKNDEPQLMSTDDLWDD
mmetsp:Transcript_24538/g.37067  ORF Transcript_24538/g.37067 Transcript_24538/m.37067 type:complete len:284 (+) Transcript_24538:70-921(+)